MYLGQAQDNRLYEALYRPRTTSWKIDFHFMVRILYTYTLPLIDIPFHNKQKPLMFCPHTSIETTYTKI